MKKISALLVLFTLVLSVCAFAAPAKKVATVSESSQTTGMRIGVGVESVPAMNIMGVPSAGLSLANFKFMGESFAGSAGFLFQNFSAAGVSGSAFGFGGKFVFNLTAGAVPTHAGIGLYFMSTPQIAALTAATSGFTIAPVYGADTIIADHLNVGFDIYPISFTSATVGTTNTTSFGILSGTVCATYLF